MLLTTDTDTLTGHDIAREATWADKYRDSDRDTTKVRYDATRLWHFVDIEVAEPNLASACFGHPPLPPGIPTSKGPPRACVVVARMLAATQSMAPRVLLIIFVINWVTFVCVTIRSGGWFMPKGLGTSAKLPRGESLSHGG